jgi:hypothetical protein
MTDLTDQKLAESPSDIFAAKSYQIRKWYDSKGAGVRSVLRFGAVGGVRGGWFGEPVDERMSAWTSAKRTPGLSSPRVLPGLKCLC